MLPDPPAHTRHSIESSLPQITQPAKFHPKEDPTQGSWRGDSLTCTQEDFGQTLGKTSWRGRLRPQDYVTRERRDALLPRVTNVYTLMQYLSGGLMHTPTGTAVLRPRSPFYRACSHEHKGTQTSILIQRYL